MNIEDVAAPAERPEDLIGAIFDRQFELMKKYHGIEEANGMLQTPDMPVDLHCRFGQARLKDFAWRMTEEFTEATESRDHKEHYLEELIDGLHFMVELMILADHRAESWDPEPFAANATPYAVIESVGCAMNCLKNKPWKQSQMLTDVGKFHGHLDAAWRRFAGLMQMSGLTLGDVYDLYFRKSEVNQFRQRSKY